ncbi:PLP-dependent aminotransferase family protein [Amaricoccus tamworthensis]|uniref:MocR-like pyridoxine biosynthesis transcription factor PdxR n=1 Tax=Amaricoccus tamworthensis TaxID=57002 RepID=UPI003C7C9359
MTTPRLPPEIFFIDRNSSRSLQAQIRETVVTSVLSGQARVGAMMPSSRRLAQHLGIARMTVTLAYQELVAQGYLQSHSRRAYSVAEMDIADASKSAPGTTEKSRGVDWGRLLNSSLAKRHRVQKPVDWRRYPYPFAYGQMDSDLFNHTAWRDCSRQAMGKRDFVEMAGDLADADDPVLVNYIRARILPRRGINASPDEILVTIGAQNALWMIVELLARKPMRAVCENPGYPDVAQALRWRGAEVVPLNIDGDGLPPENIPHGTTAVFVTPSHQAPTGTTMSRDRRETLLAKAHSEDFVVIEDDYDFEMSFLEAPSPALKSWDRDGRVLYIGSFSKALFPGLRLGYLVGSREFIAEARELRTIQLRHPPGHLQRTTAYFLAQGHYDILVTKLRREYSRRRREAERTLAGSDVRIAGAATFGGSSLWLKFPNGMDAGELALELLGHGVLIEPGAPFFYGPDAPVEFFRLGYSSIPVSKVAPGIERIVNHVAERGRG